jgi:hypothetical protein
MIEIFASDKEYWGLAIEPPRENDWEQTKFVSNIGTTPTDANRAKRKKK